MGSLKHTTELSVRISKIFTIQTPLERSSSIPLGFARQVEWADFRPAWGLNCLRSWPSLPFPTLRRSLSPIPLASLSSLLMWKMCKYTHLTKVYVYVCVCMLHCECIREPAITGEIYPGVCIELWWGACRAFRHNVRR